MTRYEYMDQLQAYLKHLPPADRQDTLDYFNEYFDEAGPDAEDSVMAELGSPRQAASDILANLYGREKIQENPRTSNMVWLLFLSICAAPMGIALATTLICTLLTILILFLSVLLLLACLWIVVFLLALSLAFLALEVLTLSWASSLLFLGLSLISLYLTILGSRLTIRLANQLLLRAIHWLQARISKGGSHEKTPAFN